MTGATDPDFSLAQAVAPELASIAVHLVTVVGQRAPTMVSSSRPRFVLTAEGAYWAKKEPDKLFVVLPFDVTTDSIDSDTGAVVELGHFYLQYQVVYSLAKPPSTWTDEVLESFAAYYGINHVWPYCRSELQTLTVKVGLAALTLPILKIGQLPSGFTISSKPPDDPAPSRLPHDA